MTQDQTQPPLNDLPQVYDTSFKNWITQQAPAILPVLLSGAVYEEALDVEIILPITHIGKTFKILYDGGEQILHLEFETAYDTRLPSWLLVYNAVLYLKYHMPVTTIVIYPFQVTMAVPPLHITSGEEEILTFRFKTLPLFELDAQDFVRQHHTCFYPLLPTMENAHASLLIQAMQELVELYRDDQGTLSEQFIWMRLLLERTDTVPDAEKVQIQGRLTMFDELWEKSPTIQKMRELYRVQGLQEGIQALQRSLVNVVRAKYPDLAELAQRQATYFNKTDILELLIQKVVTAPDESTARWFLESETTV